MSGSEPNLVSIVMCAYNAGEYLQGAVDSALGQSYSSIELLLIDDGSTDKSIQNLRCTDSRLRIISQSNQGKGVALNRGLSESRGEFLAIFDADDLAYPQRIERLVEAMHAEPELAVVMSGHDLILHGKRVAPRFRGKSPDACRHDVELIRMPAHDPTSMFRKSMLDEGGFDESLDYVEQYDMLIRVGEQRPMRVLGECLYSYRAHPSSLTRSDPGRREHYVELVRAKARRRRGESATETEAGPVQTKRYADNNLAAQFMESAVDLRQDGRRFEAVRTALRCIPLGPWSLHYYKALIYAVAPISVVRQLRREPIPEAKGSK